MKDIDPEAVALAARRVLADRLGQRRQGVVLTLRCRPRGHELVSVEAIRDERGVTAWITYRKVWRKGETPHSMSEPLTYSGTSRWAACPCPGRRLISHMRAVEELAVNPKPVVILD